MKQVLISLLLIYSVSVIASEPISFTEVVQVEGASQDELFSRARIWFSSSFKDAKAVLDVQDKESGELVGNGVIRFDTKRQIDNCYSGDVKFKIRIFVKDGRYKYELMDFYHNSTGNSICDLKLLTNDFEYPYPVKPMYSGQSNRLWKEVKEDIQLKVNLLISSLKNDMNSDTNNDDW